MPHEESLNSPSQEPEVFTPRSKNFPGENLHLPTIFPLQRQLWDKVLSQADTQLTNRVNDLLPTMPVTDPLMAELFHSYDCVAFALYVLGTVFLESVGEVSYQGRVFLQPKVKSLGWREKPWWTTEALRNFGFTKVDTLGGGSPTLVIVTLEDENFVYTKPVHFAVFLAIIEGKPYVAHKIGACLPEVLPLEQVTNIYRGEPGSLNEIPGVQFWQLGK